MTTIKELISALNKYPEDTKIFALNDDNTAWTITGVQDSRHDIDIVALSLEFSNLNDEEDWIESYTEIMGFEPVGRKKEIKPFQREIRVPTTDAALRRAKKRRLKS